MRNASSLSENGEDATYHLKSLHHVLDVLEFLRETDAPSSVTEIAKATTLVKSGAYRILHNLERRGYVHKDDQSRYSLGVKLWQLGNSLTSISSLQACARPILIGVTSVTNETTHLAVLDRAYSLYIDKVESVGPIRAYAEIGEYAPAHAVATGKVLLASLPDYELRALPHEPFEGYTANGMPNFMALQDELARIRQQGFAINDGSWRHEVVGVAVPARIHDRCTVALGAAGPRYRFSVDRALSYVPLLQEKAQELENRFHQPGSTV